MLKHDRFDRGRVILAQKQILDRDKADQLASAGDIAGVDGLFVDAGTADAEDGFLHRHIRPQGHIFRRHDGAGGVFGVAQDLIDLLAHFRLGLREDTLDDVCRHFLDNIDRVIDVQLVDDLLQLRIREAADQQLLRLRLHFDEGLRGQLLRQQPEQQRQAGFLQPVKDRGDIRGIHRG